MKRVAVLAGLVAIGFLACENGSGGDECAIPNPDFNPLVPGSVACLDETTEVIAPTQNETGNLDDAAPRAANAFGENTEENAIACPPGYSPQMLEGVMVCLTSDEGAVEESGGEGTEEGTDSVEEGAGVETDSEGETGGPGGGGPPGCQDGSFKCELGTLWKCEDGGWTKEEVCSSPIDCNAEDGNCDKCAPSCAGKGCGDDGCGGSCGTCGPGQICVNDNCQVSETGNDEEAGGDSSEEAGGGNSEEAGGDNSEEAGGGNSEEAGGDNSGEAGGDNSGEAGGDNSEEAGGDNSEETGGGEGYEGPDENVDCDPLGTGKNVGQYAKNVTWQDSTGQNVELHDFCGSNLILFVETADW